LDTVGLIALWNHNDQWHIPAKTIFRNLIPATTRLVTTSYVLLECSNACCRRPYRDEVIRLRDDLILAGDLFEPTPVEIESAWAEYTRGSAGTAGVVDLVSMTLMRRLGIREAFTNDKHFEAAGFEILF
jgi:hypothetical protein